MMKKEIKIFWNHLDGADQARAVELIIKLSQEQLDPLMKVALEAAVTELELWGNNGSNEKQTFNGKLN